LEAVATETPARDATSRIVGVLPIIDRSLPGDTDPGAALAACSSL
jgi:hypothetical protein